jgi:hypothetical protein
MVFFACCCLNVLLFLVSNCGKKEFLCAKEFQLASHFYAFQYQQEKSASLALYNSCITCHPFTYSATPTSIEGWAEEIGKRLLATPAVL